MRSSIVVPALSLLMVALPVWGQETPEEEPPWQPTIVTHLGGSHGLTGYGTMVDGRIPSPFFATPQDDTVLGAYSSRFGFRYEFRLQNRGLRGTGTKYELEEREHVLTASYGLTVQGLDLSVSLPYTFQDRRVLVIGGPNPAQDHDSGTGDLLLGAKVAFRVPNFFLEDWAIAALAPYALVRIPSGASAVRDDPAQVEYGFALAGPFGYSFRYNGNFGLLNREGGLTAFVYRFGFSAVPIAKPAFALRIWSHIDGIEYEGQPGSTMNVELGGQALIQGFLSLDLSVSLRAFDAGFADRELRRELRGVGDRFRRVDDDGALTVTVGIGVLL